MIKAAIFDLDGTLYLGKTPIAGAVKKLEELRTTGMKILFLTNAATKNRANVAQKLTQMGFLAKKEEIYCGSYILAKYIAQHHPGKTVYPVGEEGLHSELKEAGIAIVESADIVAVGLDRTFTYDKLAKAHTALMKGAIFLASNNDHTFPTESLPMPGAGALVAAIQFSSEKKPYIAGKPNPYVLELIVKEHRLKKEETVVVGDRLDTDVMFAKNCGIRSALVLSGNTKKEDIKAVKPDFVFGSVADLDFGKAQSG